MSQLPAMLSASTSDTSRRHGCPLVPIRQTKRVIRHVAAMGPKETQEAFVVVRRPVEGADAHPVIAFRVREPGLNDLPYILASQISLHERLVNFFPEGQSACAQAIEFLLPKWLRASRGRQPARVLHTP